MDKNDLNDFFNDCTITEILNHNLEISFICLLGKKQEKNFVLKLKKKEYDTLNIKQWEESIKTVKDYLKTFDNDIYTKYTLSNFLKSEVIY